MHAISLSAVRRWHHRSKRSIAVGILHRLHNHQVCPLEIVDVMCLQGRYVLCIRDRAWGIAVQFIRFQGAWWVYARKPKRRMIVFCYMCIERCRVITNRYWWWSKQIPSRTLHSAGRNQYRLSQRIHVANLWIAPDCHNWRTHTLGEGDHFVMYFNHTIHAIPYHSSTSDSMYCMQGLSVCVCVCRVWLDLL